MRVVLATLRTVADRRDALVAAARRLAAASREEAGCLGYDVYLKSDDADELLILERWQDDEAIVRHREAAHVADFMREAGDLVTGRGALVRATAD